MLNRITGWLLFTQLVYLALFVFLVVVDLFMHGVVFAAFVRLRAVLHLDNTLVRLSDYIFYPMVCSAVLNLALLLVFFWLLLRRQHPLSLASDFFSFLNAIYIATSGWVLFSALTSLVHH